MAPKKPKRSTDAVLYLYCSDEQKKRIEEAVAKVQEGLPGGAKIAVYAWALQQVLDAADKVLSEKS